MKVVFITPFYNGSKNFETLITSILDQENQNWEHIFIDDISTDDSLEVLNNLTKDDNRFSVISNKEKQFALKNIIDVARDYQDNEDVIVAVIDGDDSLCNTRTVDLLISEYESGSEVVWTGHKWDINSMNISREMPNTVNPYQWPWCSSHLKTFKASLLQSIDDDNFKDLEGNWFIRGYDQALMLPALYVAKKRKYVDEICYQYNINSVSVENRVWVEKDQMFTINLIRSRGFVG